MEELLKEISSARYGFEVREPIATILEDVHNLMVEPVENKEVVQARESHGTLGERLDNIDKVDALNTALYYMQIFGKGV